MIRITDLCKSYGDKDVIRCLNATVPDRGFVTVTGESGIGKTTLIRLILGLEEPDRGSITFSSEPVFSVVFQEDRLLERLSVLENVTIVMKGSDKKADGLKAVSILTKLGLENDLGTLADKLSGGMKRRTAIARALACDADIYIMDEPIKGLDRENRAQTLKTIREYTKDRLLILITHDKWEMSGADLDIRLENPI